MFTDGLSKRFYRIVAMKLCSWCAIFGRYPVEDAWRPDDEEGAYDIEGNWICDTCKKHYDEGREEQKRMAMKNRKE